MIKRGTASGIFDGLIELLLNAERDENGILHIRQDAWQRLAGYNDIYDAAFIGTIGTTGYTAERIKYPFEANGEEYIVWLWKGDYLGVGAGAEAGIYNDPVLGHWKSAVDDAVPMSLKMNHSEYGTIVDYAPDEPQWWINAFDSNHQNVFAEDLSIQVEMDFSGNPDLWEGFHSKYNNDERLTFVGAPEYSVTIEW